MQRLLTEDEYIALVNAGRERTKKQVEQLQRFCTMVADKLPVAHRYGPDSPNGCILTAGSHVEYCDFCPARDMCPHEFKQWSK